MPKSRSPNHSGGLVAFLEATYALERDDGAWLREVLRAVLAMCPEALAVWGLFHDATPAGAPHVARLLGLARGATPRQRRALLRWLRQAGTWELITRKRVQHLRWQQVLRDGHARRLFDDGGLGTLVILGGERTGRGCLVFVGLEPGARTALRRATTCELVADHLLKAHPLRRRLQGIVQTPWSETPRPGDGGDVLALREREVVLLAAVGKSSKVIAHELGIASATVRVLLARAAAKLGVRSRADLFSHPSVLALRGPTDAAGGG
jgi:DNA-binding CsgD family transcriptional regulator